MLDGFRLYNQYEKQSSIVYLEDIKVIQEIVTVFILMGSKNIFSAISLFFLYSGKQRRNIRIIGGCLLAIGIIGMITTGSIVIQDTAKNNLTPKGYPKTEILGISIYSFE